jgi:hypothetical protein
MSTTNRPTSRWLSSTKSNNLINQTSQKKLSRPLINQQHNYSQRSAKSNHDVEQLFKLYYSTNIQFDTFQKQVVTGTRIPSAQTPTITQHHLINSSSNVFRSKHCVSREDELNLSDIDEQQIINTESKQIPILKRTVQVRINNTPHSTSPSPEGIPLPSISDLTITENHASSSQQNEFNESSIMKSVGFADDISTDFHEHNYFKKSKPISSIVPLPPVSLTNNRKDLMNTSLSSFSTVNSLQTSNHSHIITGTAVMVRERSPTKSALLKHRTKSNAQQTNLKTRYVCFLIITYIQKKTRRRK